MDRALVVLVVEDSPSDRRLTAHTLADSGLAIRLFEVERADHALAFLRREGEYAECPRPDLVLLDLGLPGMTGQELLGELRADPELRTVPVVVQTSSDDDRTMLETLGLGAHEFVTKPIGLEQFKAVVEYVTQFA